MNTRQTHKTANSSLNKILVQGAKRKSAGYFFLSIFLLMTLGHSAMAQSTAAVRFTFAQDRFTVPLNSSNVTSITNTLQLVNIASNANFSVSGLPPGATAVLTDTNGNPLLSTTGGSN